jgi:hypothetical protein
MSSGAYAGALRLERHRSRILAGALAGLHLGALAVLLLTPLPKAAALALLAAVVASLHSSLRRHVFLSGRRAVQSLLWEPTGAWTLQCGGQQFSASLLAGSFVTPALIILRFVPDSGGGAYTVVLPSDGADPDALRRLRVRLRLGLGIAPQ